jgi:hypothetical protein
LGAFASGPVPRWSRAASPHWLPGVRSGNVLTTRTDLPRFTYIDYTLVTIDYLLLLYAMRRVWLFQAFIMYLLPIIIGTTLSVTVSIVVILKFNGSLLLAATALNGGEHTVGTVHAAHAIVHFFTSIDLLLVLLFNWSYIRANYRAIFFKFTTSERVFHAGWFILSTLGIMTLYMLNFDFISNYPVGIRPWQSVLMQMAICIGIGLLFWLGLVVGDHDPNKVNRTPIYKWNSVL